MQWKRTECKFWTGRNPNLDFFSLTTYLRNLQFSPWKLFLSDLIFKLLFLYLIYFSKGILWNNKWVDRGNWWNFLRLLCVTGSHEVRLLFFKCLDLLPNWATRPTAKTIVACYGSKIETSDSLSCLYCRIAPSNFPDSRFVASDSQSTKSSVFSAV